MATTSHASTTARLAPALAPTTASQSSRLARLAHLAGEAPFLDLDEPEDQDRGAIATARPDTAHVRALRFLNATGELLACLILIAGGMVATGLASLL